MRFAIASSTTGKVGGAGSGRAGGTDRADSSRARDSQHCALNLRCEGLEFGDVVCTTRSGVVEGVPVPAAGETTEAAVHCHHAHLQPLDLHFIGASDAPFSTFMRWPEKE